MNTDQLQDATDWLMACGPFPLAFFGSIIFGYFLRWVPAFPNKWIPPFVIISATVIFAIASHRSTSMPAREFYVRVVIIGLFIGMAAWLLHDKYGKVIEEKLTTKFPAAGAVATTTAEDGTKQWTKPEVKPPAPDKPAA